MDSVRLLTSYDYKLVSRFEFEQAQDRPIGLLERASTISGAYIVYDPMDDDQGFLLIGNDVLELANKACEHLDLA